MSEPQSTTVGLKLQDCPGGGWTGMPAELERATVADCLAHGVCGCIYGGAVQQIELLLAEVDKLRLVIQHEADCTEAADDEAMRRGHEIERLRAALEEIRASKMPGESRAIAIRTLNQQRPEQKE